MSASTLSGTNVSRLILLDHRHLNFSMDLAGVYFFVGNPMPSTEL